jgi:hypothetical protein
MANLSRIAFVLRTIPNLNSEEITGIYPGELFLVGDKKAIFYKQEDGTVISPSDAASTFLTIEGNLNELPNKDKARENLGIKSAALKDSGTDSGNLYSIGDFNSFLSVSSASNSLDFNTYAFRSNEVIVLSKTAAFNIPVELDLATVSIINVLATGTATNGGFVAIVSDMSNLKSTYLLRCSITNNVRSFSVESIYTNKHKPSLDDLNVYSKDDAKSKFMQLSNLFSEIVDANSKKTARQNLGLGTASTLDTGPEKGKVLLVGDNGLGVNANPVASAKSAIPAFYQLADGSSEKPDPAKQFGFISFPISNSISGYLRVSSTGEFFLGIDNGNGIDYTKVYLANSKPTLTELKAVGTDNNLSDLADKAAARQNLGLGDASTKNVGTSSGTVAAGDDTRIVKAVQFDQNLADLGDKSAARQNLGLDTASQKKAQTSLTDTTTGSLMVVGAFGIGGAAIKKTAATTPDIKAFLSTAPSGIYHFDEASAYTNGPVDQFLSGAGWFDLIVTAHETDVEGYKTAIAVSSYGEMCLAVWTSRVAWTGWTPIYTENSGGLVLPVGVPIPYPLATPPKNFLKANGGAFDQVAYPKLLTVYPSGYLPDLRGEFIRGWDDGRNIDTGRSILTSQSGTQIGLNVESNDTIGTFLTINAGEEVVSTITGAVGKLTWTGTSAARQFYKVRPRNIAFNYIIRAK